MDFTEQYKNRESEETMNSVSYAILEMEHKYGKSVMRGMNYSVCVIAIDWNGHIYGHKA